MKPMSKAQAVKPKPVAEVKMEPKSVSGWESVSACCVKPESANKISARLAKVLDQWMKGRNSWNHQDWLDLLEDLRKKGVGELTHNQAGKEAIGMYLEQNRKK